MAMRMQLAEVLPADERTVLWDLTRQLGVQQVVSGIPDGPDLPPAWDFDRLRQIKARWSRQPDKAADMALHCAQLDAAWRDTLGGTHSPCRPW